MLIPSGCVYVFIVSLTAIRSFTCTRGGRGGGGVEMRKECICVNGGGGHTGQEMPVQMEE